MMLSMEVALEVEVTMTASATPLSVENLPLPLSELATSTASFSTIQRMKVVEVVVVVRIAALERPIRKCKIKFYFFVETFIYNLFLFLLRLTSAEVKALRQREKKWLQMLNNWKYYISKLL